LVRKPELPGVVVVVPLANGAVETGGMMGKLLVIGATLDSVLTGEMAVNDLLVDDSAETPAPDGEAV
jgi:hypothetical protein